MRWLAWDTSTRQIAICAMELQQTGPVPAAELVIPVDIHSDEENLLWGIHEVLSAAGWKIEQIDFIGAGVGPGSFTGLRIGLTTARTLAHSLGKRLVGFSSLLAWARPVARFIY